MTDPIRARLEEFGTTEWPVYDAAVDMHNALRAVLDLCADEVSIEPSEVRGAIAEALGVEL